VEKAGGGGADYLVLLLWPLASSLFSEWNQQLPKVLIVG
jgi:hypothetical protein